MNKRLAARLSLGPLVLTLALGIGRTVPTLAAEGAVDDSSEFILRAPADRVQAIAGRYGLTIVRPVEGHPDVYLVRRAQPTGGDTNSAPPPGAVSDALQQLTNSLLADPDVQHFEVNGSASIAETVPGAQLNESTVTILDSLGDRTLTGYFGASVWSRYVNQPATGIMHLAQAQQLATGSGTVVAIIDTGVDPHHPALQGVLVAGYDFTRDLPGPASEWADLDESTVTILDSATASILDPSSPVALNESTVVILDSATTSSVDLTQLPHAFGHGTMVAGLVHVVAPGARIMPLKAFRADGTSNLFDIERAIYYAVDHGAKVINMSFSMDVASAEITHAIDYASSHGVICLASAGNAGRSTVVFPAGFRNVMGIGSTSAADERSTFSNYGDHLVRFAAPGETLITLYPGRRYAGVSGTSFSTALVAGAAGMLSQLEPTIDQRLAGRYLDDGAFKKPDWQLGDGRIDLYETLRTHSTTIIPPPPPPDTTAPTLTLSTPANGATVTGLVALAASASDNVGVVGVQFVLDGVALGVETTTAPYQRSWNTAAMSNGGHVLTAVARDAAGNREMASVTVTIANDTTAPAVTVTSPADGATVTGTITFAASASDDVAVAGVQFTLDGVNLGAERTVAPYEVSWNSSTASNAAHVLAAVARDAAGNQRTASVSVTVANDTTPPTVTVLSPVTGAVVMGPIALVVTAADDVAMAGVQYALDGVNLGAENTAAPYELSWNSATVANGAHTLTATARDAAGNQHTDTIDVTVANDTTAPAVAMTSPAADATINGTVTIDASASDDDGVAGVQFTLDGVSLGTERTDAPFTLEWDSATVPNGVHVLAATARDTSGNQRSATETIIVANVTPALP